jgi:hypothetical protein
VGDAAPQPHATATVPVVADRPAPRRRRRLPRRAIGALLVVFGLVTVGFVGWATTIYEPPRRVGRLIGSDLGTAALVTTPSAPVGSDAPGDPDGPASWPFAVQGRPPAFGADGDPPPASADGVAPGWYLWSDFRGWHLWAVGEVEGSVVVTTNGSFLAEATGGPVDLVVEEERLELRRGTATEPVVGVDFNPGFFANELTVTVDGGAPLRTGYWLADATSPLTLRFERPR